MLCSRRFSILLGFAFFGVSCVYGASYAPDDDYGVDAIYGLDNRKFITSNSAPKIQELAKSIALIVSKNAVKKRQWNSFIDTQMINTKNGSNLCYDQKFSLHNTINSCSGFLIGSDLLASAGHCFESELDCTNQAIIFDVELRNEIKDGLLVRNENVFSCKEIIVSLHNTEKGMDFSIIRLSRKVVNASPLKVKMSYKLTSQDQVFMIGHPLGLPLILTGKTPVINNKNSPYLFNAQLDSFEGNSGSPVFNAKTFEVEGILVQGEEDFVENKSKSCMDYEVYGQNLDTNKIQKSEGITKIKIIHPFFKN